MLLGAFQDFQTPVQTSTLELSSKEHPWRLHGQDILVPGAMISMFERKIDPGCVLSPDYPDIGL